MIEPCSWVTCIMMLVASLRSTLLNQCEKQLLYILGGRQGKLPVASLETYDFRECKWRKLPDIPSKRVFAMYTTDDDNKIFSCGGLNQNPKDGMSAAMESYDIRNGEVYMCNVVRCLVF